MTKIKSIFDLSAFEYLLENKKTLTISKKDLSTAKKMSYSKSNSKK